MSPVPITKNTSIGLGLVILLMTVTVGIAYRTGATITQQTVQQTQMLDTIKDMNEKIGTLADELKALREDEHEVAKALVRLEGRVDSLEKHHP